MSTQRELEPSERLMLFREWGKRCVWCKQPLRYESYEVEHLVPKTLTGTKLQETLHGYGLPNSFDVYSLENLAPSCRVCNGAKGNRPVRSAPIVVTILDKAALRAPKISRKAAKFNRERMLSELLVLFHTLNPRGDLDALRALLEPSQQSLACMVSAEPPKLKRSKNRLDRAGAVGDEERMLMLLGEWNYSRREEVLDLVEDTFNADDSKATRTYPIAVNFLAYSREIGDFLASVTFQVEYDFTGDDVTAPATANHEIQMWITLDTRKEEVVDVVEDRLDSLLSCKGYA